MNFVNFGIDLGTTNSLIAKFEDGQVQVFKNPIGHKETLPSVVAFRGDRTLVGDKAREYITKDAGNVFGSFKRKMGTGEKFLVPSTMESTSPIDLSALVLKELKNFVHTGEPVDAAVITIPASFDTVQSNATKKAGYEAGFKEVLLLQEPVAASLAYFNESKRELPESGNWLVYDLGGGTFDVALVTIQNGELRVADHEGNNFLGGVDFDALIIEKIIVPKLVAVTGNAAIEEELRNRSGRLEKLYYLLLYKAEEAKKELSAGHETEIEFTLPDSDQEIIISITRGELNEIIHDRIADTISLLKSILQRNNLQASDVSNIVMVGGSTYIPYVRQLLTEQTGISLAFDADPTTAVAVGAAYYAGSKLRSVAATSAPVNEMASLENSTVDEEANRRLKAVFQTVSSEEEELYMAVPEGDFENVFYRITRSDGGYDSGTKPVAKRIQEFLPLHKGTLNSFSIRFFNAQNDAVKVEHSPIQITQGKFNVAGQPLPNDICLEVDDIEGNSTRLQVLFQRNDILPLKRTIYKEITRTIPKDSSEILVINVLEGSRHSRPHSNQVIGAVEIKGKDLKTDLVKGSDIELKFEISESRDLSITAYLAMTEQEFKNVFTPTEKYVSVARLKDDLNSLLVEMRRELRDEKFREEESEWTTELRGCIVEAEKLQQRLGKMKEKDITDSKYEINESRRRLSGKYDSLGEENRFLTLQEDYYEMKGYAEEQLPYVDFNREKLVSEFDRIVADERQFLKAKSPALLRSKIDGLQTLHNKIHSNTKQFLTQIFMSYSQVSPDQYPKPNVAKTLIRQGEEALEKDHFEALRSATISLSHLWHGDDVITENSKIKGTGIG